ncbi:transporter, partial [bacterium]|nr:transporter [bacterium]
MNRATALGLTAILLLAAPAAQALPIVGASANTIPRGTFMIDTWGTWLNFTKSWQEDGNGGSSWVGFREDRKWTAGSLVPRVYYGVTDRFTVRAAFPLEDRYREYEFDGPAESATGLGDIVIDPKFQIFRAESGYPRVAALAGVRFPTGDTGGDGRLPLSDGSTDYMLGAVVTHKECPITAHACVAYWFNGNRESGTNVPDLIVGLASIETPLD